jgi:protein gp37
MDTTKGKWWERALSLVEGCTPVSPACDHCWLAQDSYMRQFQENAKIAAANIGLTMKKAGGCASFSGTVRIREDRLDIPLRTRKPTVWAVWSDLFHEKVNYEFLWKTLLTIYHSSQHTFLILTKRPENIDRLFQNARIYKRVVTMASFQQIAIFRDLQEGRAAENIYFGTTVENQEQADRRVPEILKIPGKRFLSVEPILSGTILQGYGEYGNDKALVSRNYLRSPLGEERIHAVIVGCESGPKRRECKIEWVESIIEQCKAAGVPVFVKQVSINGRVSKNPEEWPESIRERQLPWG